MERVFSNFPIHWINLDISIDRKENMEGQLQKMNHTRISAVDGLCEQNFLIKYKIIGGNPKFTCALKAALCSHVKAIKKAYDNKLPYVIILEDKCQFDFIEYYANTVQNIIDLAQKVDPNWDIIQLASVPLYDNFIDFNKYGLRIHKRRSNLYGLNYLINYDAMEKILNSISTDGEILFDLSNITRDCSPEETIYSRLNTYIVNNPLFYIYAYKSTFPQYLINQNSNDKNIAKKMQLTAFNKMRDFYMEKNNSRNVQFIWKNHFNKYLKFQRNYTNFSPEKLGQLISKFETEISIINSFIDEPPQQILDIGCGLGIYDLALQKFFGTDIKFYLLDKTTTKQEEKKIYYGYREKPAFYNNLDYTKEFLQLNGIDEKKMEIISVSNDQNITNEYLEKNLSNIDIVVSTISCGFHYPVKVYLDTIYKILKPNGIFCLNCRNIKENLPLLQSKFNILRPEGEKIPDGYFIICQKN